MRLRERLHAWRFFLPRILLILAGLAAAVLPVRFRSGDAWRWALALSLLLATLTITSAARNWMSVVGRRALALGGVVAFALIYFDKLPSAWTVVAVLVIGAGTMARRQIGSPSPRFIGVPRPDVVDEVLNPVEGTSDDAERLVDALDGVWGSTREGGPRHGRRAAHADGSGPGDVSNTPPTSIDRESTGSRCSGLRPVSTHSSGSPISGDSHPVTTHDGLQGGWRSSSSHPVTPIRPCSTSS